MTVQEAYKRFLLMINKNDTNEGIFIPPYIFVLLYNAEKDRWEAEALKRDEDNIDVNKIQELLIPNFKLNQVSKTDKTIIFDLPDDFFQTYGSYSFADQGKCFGTLITNYERKPGNLLAILSDDSNLPSFEYQESSFILASNQVILFTGDYSVTSTYLNYYRKPIEIQMEGYENFDGTPSINVDPDLDDFNVIEILDRMAIEVQRQIENGEGFQFSKDRKNDEL